MWIILFAHLLMALVIFVNSNTCTHNRVVSLRWSALGLFAGILGAGIWQWSFKQDRGIMNKVQVLLLTLVVESAVIYIGVTAYILS